jgi:hypothetical protein
VTDERLAIRAQRLAPLALLVVAFMLGGGPFYWGLIFVAVALGSLLTPKAARLTAFGELVVTLSATALPLGWARAIDQEIGLAIPFTLAVFVILAVRLFLSKPLWGESADRIFALAAAVAIGLGLQSRFYPYLVTLFVFALLWRSRVGHPHKAPVLRGAPRAHLRARIAVFAVAGSLMATLLVVLPALNEASNRRFSQLFQGSSHSTGFSPYVRLDGGGDIAETDEIMFRITQTGAANAPDYLRGAVLDSFDGNFWTTSPTRLQLNTRSIAFEATSADSSDYYVHSARKFPWVFVELGAQVSGARGLSADPFAAIRAEGLGVDSWGMSIAKAGSAVSRSTPQPLAPGPEDLAVPPALFAPLHTLAKAWTVDASDDAERIGALRAHLQTYHYSLTRKGSRARNPLLGFLFDEKSGHCEYFASSLAMLARTLQIPTRLVTGYRVVEHNAYGNYEVVRSKNAHAWVEVYVQSQPLLESGAARPSEGYRTTVARSVGGWSTVDPTPVTEGAMARRSSGAWAFIDYVKFRAKDVYNGFMAKPERVVGVLASVIALAFFVRSVANYRQRRRLRTDATEDDAPAYFQAFEKRLRAIGFPRGEAETLERYAVRLRGVNMESAAHALEAYARLRYGRPPEQEVPISEVSGSLTLSIRNASKRQLRRAQPVFSTSEDGDT